MTDEIYEKIVVISERVIFDLKKKGLVIPTENTDGTITIGNYTIAKDKDGFYFIFDNKSNIVLDKLNLPQTAIVIANDLALNRAINSNLLNKDREYGYALFEETLQKRAMEKHFSKNPDLADIRSIKFIDSKIKKETCKKHIIHSFEKLRKFA